MINLNLYLHRSSVICSFFQVVSELSKAAGISKILVADSEALAGFLPERLAPLVTATHSQFKFTHIVGKYRVLNIGKRKVPICDYDIFFPRDLLGLVLTKV